MSLMGYSSLQIKSLKTLRINKNMTVKYKQREPKKLNPSDKNFYLDNGYLVVKKLFTHSECDEILGRLTSYKNSKGAAMMNMDREYELSRYSQEKIAEERGISFDSVPLEDIPFDRIVKDCQLFREFMRDQRFVSFLEQLHQGEYEVMAGRDHFEWGGLMTQIIFKDQKTQYANQAWNPHQDNSYVRNPNGLYVTTNTFFENADMGNGTMFIYPGTHKEGILPCKEVKSFRESEGENPGNISVIPLKYERVDLEFEKGDILFLNGNVVHGSYPNKSLCRNRPLYMNVYIPRGEFFMPGRGSRKMFIPLD